MNNVYHQLMKQRDHMENRDFFTLKLTTSLETVELKRQKAILKPISEEDDHLQRKGYSNDDIIFFFLKNSGIIFNSNYKKHIRWNNFSKPLKGKTWHLELIIL